MAYPPQESPDPRLTVGPDYLVNGVRETLGAMVPVGGAYDTVQALGLGDPASYLAGGANFQGPIQPANDDPSWYRDDGTKKGQGFLGLFHLPDGGVASEYSLADSERLIDLKDHKAHWQDYPSLVPTLTPDEVQQTLHAIANKSELPETVKQKAEAFAIQRARQGKPLFATAAESPLQVGGQTVAQPPLAVSHAPTQPPKGPRLAVSHGTENRPAPAPAGGALFQGPVVPQATDLRTGGFLQLPVVQNQVGDQRVMPDVPPTILDKGMDFLRGVTGFGNQGPAGQTWTNAGALLSAAMPFAGVLREAEAGPGLYSRVEKALTQIPEQGAHPNKILSVLKSTASPEEVAYRQVPEFLAGKTKVTRAELQAHLAEHPAPVPTVITRGGPPATMDPRQAMAARVDAARQAAFGDHRDWLGVSQTDRANAQWWATEAAAGDTRALRKLREMPVDEDHLARLLAFGRLRNEEYGMGTAYAAANPGTKYQGYQVPGGEAYRETLLTLPQQKIEQLIAEQMHVGEQMRATGTTPALVDRYNQLQAQINATPAPYQSSHFDEPNIVVHTRSHERTLPTGERGRFVEEVQSDWHQKGKKAGYRATDAEAQAMKARIDAIDAEKTQLAHQRDPRTNKMLDEPRWHELSRERETLYDRYNRTVNDAVPDAPFKESWPELGLKQQLLEAAQDPETQWLGFTDAQTQIDRYDLSKQVRQIDYRRRSDGRFDLGLVGLDGEPVELPKATYSADELAGTLGTEVAEKIVAGHGQPGGGRMTLSGEDLKVGGKGMRYFYDNLLPERLQKMVKPFGGTVERAPLTGGTQGWIVRLSPEMKAKILKGGLPLMALAPVALAVSHEQTPPPKAPPLAVSHPQVAATYPRFTETLDRTRTR